MITSRNRTMTPTNRVKRSRRTTSGGGGGRSSARMRAMRPISVLAPVCATTPRHAAGEHGGSRIDHVQAVGDHGFGGDRGVASLSTGVDSPVRAASSTRVRVLPTGGYRPERCRRFPARRSRRGPVRAGNANPCAVAQDHRTRRNHGLQGTGAGFRLPFLKGADHRVDRQDRS